MSFKRQAQSFIEYAALIAVIVLSLLAMTRYMQRGISARVELVRQGLNHTVDGNRKWSERNQRSSEPSEGSESGQEYKILNPDSMVMRLEHLEGNYFTLLSEIGYYRKTKFGGSDGREYRWNPLPSETSPESPEP